MPQYEQPYEHPPESSHNTTWMRQQATGYRSSGPPSPTSFHGISPPPHSSVSPTRPTIATRDQRRLNPTSPNQVAAEPFRISVDTVLGDVSQRFEDDAGSQMPSASPRRRSTSLEGMRPRRTPSPDQSIKRARTNTVTSQLPPSLAALALSGPVDAYASPAVARRLPSLSTTQDRPNGLPMSAPTLPPPRGWHQEHDRHDGHYALHTANPVAGFSQLRLQSQFQSDIPGPGPSFYQQHPQDHHRR